MKTSRPFLQKEVGKEYMYMFVQDGASPIYFVAYSKLYLHSDRDWCACFITCRFKTTTLELAKCALCFQDEKNQIMKSNVWLRMVHTHTSATFYSFRKENMFLHLH